MTNAYTNYFGGNLIQTTDVGYSTITFTDDGETISLQWPTTYLSSSVNQAVYSQILNVNSSNETCILVLPDQTQVSVGQTIFIQNSGDTSFTVNPYLGAQVVVIAPGEYYFLWLFDNTADATSSHWGSVKYGSSVTQAQASSLVGNGLIAQGLTLNRNRYTQTINGNYNSSTNDRDTFFVYQGGIGTFTLPDAGSAGNGWQVSINNNSSTGGVLTVNPKPAQFIDSVNSFTIIPQESITFISDGQNWYSLGYSQLEQYTYGINNLDLSTVASVYALSSAEARQSIQQFTGALTENKLIYFPPSPFSWYVSNDTTGGSFTVTLQIDNASETIIIPQGEKLIIYSNGASLYQIPNINTSSFPLTAPNGSASNPSYSFATSTNSGMFYSSADSGKVEFSIEGNNLLLLNAADESVYVTNLLNVLGSVTIDNDLIVGGDTTVGGLLTASSQILLSSLNALNQRIVFGTTPSISLGSVAALNSVQFQAGTAPYTPLLNISPTAITFSVPAVFSGGQSSASFQATSLGTATVPAFGLSGFGAGMSFSSGGGSISFSSGGVSRFSISSTNINFLSPITTDNLNPSIKTTSFNNLSPCTTAGDMIAYDGTNNVRVAAPTTNNEVMLSRTGGLPVWGGYPVLQVIKTNISTNQTITLPDATSLATGITASITPLATNSKIMVIVQVWGCVNNGTSPVGPVNLAFLQIYRNTTVIDTNTGIINNLYNVGSSIYPNLLYSSFLDSPATTSATSYTIYVYGIGNYPTTAYINQTSAGATGFQSTITLIELGGF